MPFYEYECAACGHCLEAMQKFSDAPLRKCPACSKNRLKKLMSAPAFRLKGAGWYETDFKGDKDNKRNIAGDTDKAAPVVEKPAEKVAEKAADKPIEKPAEKAAEKPAAEPKKKVDKKTASKTSKKKRSR